MGYAIFFFLEALSVLQGWLAFQAGFLTLTQMRGQGVTYGLPLLYHGGAWLDALVMAPLVSFIWARSWRQWKQSEIGWTASAALVATLFFNWLWARSPLPEAFVNHQQTTLAGLVHLVSMLVILTTLALFYFFPKSEEKRLVKVTSWLLAAHFFIGTNMLIGMAKKITTVDWYPNQPLNAPVSWYLIIVMPIIVYLLNKQRLRLLKANSKTPRLICH